MGRSAAQKASRRLRRQMMPTFPFTSLPSELQLQVLCKCDPISIRRLMKLNPKLRNIFLQYPEASLQEMFQEIPAPILNLVRASWAFHTISDEDFDGTKVLDFLLNTRLDDWASVHPRFLAEHDDPLDTLNGLIDFYEEVDVAAELMAQSMNAATETMMNPHIAIQPMGLSTAERIRMQYSLAIVRLFYQLRSRFGESNHLFPTIFTQSLYPWQLQQCCSVQAFLRLICVHCDFDLYRLLDEKHRSFEILSQRSTYFQKHLDMMENDSFSSVLYSHAFVTVADGIVQLPNGLPTWIEGPSKLGDPALASPFSNQLRSHGHSCFESLQSFHRFTVVTKYAPLFQNLGLFFWDQDRLADWGLVNPSDFSNAGHEYPRTYDLMLQKHRGGNYYQSAGEEQMQVKAQQIMEWTRCPVECEFEDWLYQEIALARCAERRPPFPLNFLEPGTQCYNCGIRGHRAYWCRAKKPDYSSQKEEYTILS